MRNPDEVLKTMKQAEDATTPAGETRRLFKRLNLNFGAKDRHFRKPPPKEHKSSDENRNGEPFSSFFDGKSSLFSKRSPSPKPQSMSPAERPNLVDNDWTVV